MSALDPHPSNQLQKGILSRNLEAKLLEMGFIYAILLPKRVGRPFATTIACKRPIGDAVADMELDNPYVSRADLPVIRPLPQNRSDTV